MRSLDFGRYALTSCVATAMLAGCGGSQPPIGAPGAMPQTAAITTRAERGTSWMLPEAKTDDLLYASNQYGYGPNGVFIFSYKRGKQVGFLSGFPATVAGLCSDKAGDVFVVTNSYNSSGGNYIYEFAHGASEPSATLDDGAGDPFGCAVDPTTGNLAVTNYVGFGSGGYGNVAIYQDASGSPSIYSDDSWITNPQFGAYDGNGICILTMDGTTQLRSSLPAAARLPTLPSLSTSTRKAYNGTKTVS
jgi:hypothetical protein